jgi:hypothetical protein
MTELAAVGRFLNRKGAKAQRKKNNISFGMIAAPARNALLPLRLCAFAVQLQTAQT